MKGKKQNGKCLSGRVPMPLAASSAICKFINQTNVTPTLEDKKIVNYPDTSHIIGNKTKYLINKNW